MQIGLPEQMWNTLLTNAKVLVQLSLSQGIPEFLLEAVQKGKPIITIREAGHYSFIQKAENIFLVERDTDAVSKHLYHLLSNVELHRQMSFNARKLSDSLTTVGNAVSWLFLASKLSRDDMIEENLYEQAEREIASSV